MRPVRFRSACDACNASKTKCSGQSNGCNRCTTLQLRCHYSESRVGRVPGIRGRNRKQENQSNRCQSNPQKQPAVQERTPSETLGDGERIRLGSPSSPLNDDGRRQKGPENTQDKTFSDDLWPDISPATTTDSTDTPWSQWLYVSPALTTTDLDKPETTQPMQFAQPVSLDPFSLQCDDPTVNGTDFSTETIEFTPDSAPRLSPGVIPDSGGFGKDPTVPKNSSFAVAVCGDDSFSNHRRGNSDQYSSHNTTGGRRFFMRPLLQIAHQLESYIVRDHDDLYTMLNVVKLGIKELQAVIERQHHWSNLDRSRVELIVCTVAHQVTDLLNQTCNIALRDHNKARRDSVSSMRSSPNSGGGGTRGSMSALEMPMNQAVQIDDDDRRIVQAVMVQRQVKRGLAVTRRLRATQGAHSGNYDRRTADDGDVSASVLELAKVERRLMRLATLLQKEADADI